MRRAGGILVSVVAVLASLALPPAGAAKPLRVVGSIPFAGGTDMAFRGDVAYVGSWAGEGGGVRIVDISQPGSPRLLSRFPCGGNQNDVGVWRTTLVVAMHSAYEGPGCTAGRGGIRLVDVSDPTRPRETGFLRLPPAGTHTVTIVGSTGYVYANPGGIGTEADELPTTIVDIRDPRAPKIAGTFTPPGSTGCHDINVVGDRAYCAGSNVTQIWDVSDPVRPVVISAIVNPAIFFHHTAVPSSDGDTLVIADEAFGVHACDPTGKNPTGAFWFYDITVEQAPVLRGWIGNTEQLGYGHIFTSKWCTVHNFNMVPGKDWMVAAAYNGGTSIIDFSEPSLPTVIAHLAPTGADTWSSYYHRGYVYASDLGRGFDVMEYAPLLSRR